MSKGPDRVERRLAAIFAADVASYSRLMGEDEVATLRALTAHREVMDRLIAEHGGRIANTAGDSVLAEFPSAVDAVQCAIEVQKVLGDLNIGVDSDRALRFRIGIHVGDVMVRGGDLLGDGVNVAARLEGIAEPGGICISSDAQRQVRKALPIQFNDLGTRQVKNIEEPVHVYSWAPEQTVPTTDFARVQAKPLPLPDKPSIAVLPFTNMSGEPDDYFADGVVEDIITALSRIRQFFVIARNSTFAYKGKAVDIRQVGRELGVRYVLEGSIRKAGNRIRMTGQLIEAATGHHIWADKFDGALEDIFDLQDQVTESVVGAIEPSLRIAEIERARAKPTDSLDAYDLYLRALPHHYAMKKERSAEALALFATAYTLDPSFALAKATAAGTHVFRKAQVWNEPDELKVGYELALEAASMAPDDPQVLRLSGQAAVYLGRDYDYGLSLVQRAVAINPNSAQVLNSAAWTYNYCILPQPAIEYFQRAIRLSPLDVEKPLMLSGLSFSYFLLKDYETMFSYAVQATREMPKFVSGHRFAAAALACLGRLDEARQWAARHMALAPDYHLSTARPILGWREGEAVDRYFNALQAAGIPE